MEAPEENRKKNHITVRDLLRFLTSSRRIYSTLVRNTKGFTGGWTMGPSAAWFYKGHFASTETGTGTASVVVGAELS